MAAEDITVVLPIGSPEGTNELMGDIIAQNTALAANSPIATDFDWVAIAAQHLLCKQLKADADLADDEMQGNRNIAETKIGSGEGQTLQVLNTLHYFIVKSRDFLKVKYNVTPESLEVWGFNVVISQFEGKRTVAIDIPLGSPTDMIELAANINKRHTALGVNSPLTGKVDMLLFAGVTQDAKDFYEKAENNRIEKEAKNNQLANLLGYAEGQTIDTPGTTYYNIGLIRDLLLATYSEKPKELLYWGFEVHIGSSSHGGGGGTPPAPVE